MTAARAVRPAPRSNARRAPFHGSPRSRSSFHGSPRSRSSAREPQARSLPQESTGPRLRLAVDRRELGWRTVLVCCAVGFFATLVVSVAIQGERIKTQERADLIAHRMEEAQVEHRDLRVQAAQAESPQQILEAARELGMVEPGPIAAVPAAETALPTPPAPDTVATTVPAPTSVPPSSRLPAPDSGNAG